jgi:AraC family transcriptional regulator
MSREKMTQMENGGSSPSELAPGAFLAQRHSSVQTPALILGYWTALRAYHIAPHYHSSAHFMLVTSGSYVTRADGNRSDGDELLIFNPPGTEHDDHLQTGGGFFTLTIREPSFLEAAQSLPTIPTTINFPSSLSRVRRLLRELGSWGNDSNVVAECLAAELIASFQGTAYSITAPAWLNRARDLLEECYREPLHLNGIAADLDVHPVYLTRCFRNYYGTTPGEYLRARRLREAATLLTRTSIPLAELALEIGFADQAHLTHRFSAAFGISPGAYRRRTQV